MNTTSSAVEVFVAKGTLTQADLLDMYANPVLVLGPPPAGANYMYVVHQLVMKTGYNTEVFFNGGNIYLQYGNAVYPNGIAATSTIDDELLITGSNQVAVATGMVDHGALSTITGTGPAGSLYITNTTGAFGGGNANSTATYYIYYSTLNVL
jgi:hypothetical protein